MRIKAASMSACGLSRHFVFEADTGLASADHNGSFDDHGFHRCAPTGCQVKTIWYFAGK